MERQYLGGHLYADIDDDRIILVAKYDLYDDDVGDVIALEPKQVDALLKFINDMRKEHYE